MQLERVDVLTVAQQSVDRGRDRQARRLFVHGSVIADQ